MDPVIEHLKTIVGAHGVLGPADLGARGTATLGGTVATNAGGNRARR